jgi:basic amino acid/polyamine antiporter, APA family
MTPSTSTEQHPHLLRVISRWEIVALSVNDVVGSGVYLILPVAAAALLGPASIWAILAAGLAVLLLVLCFAEAGSLFDKAGGAYLYTRAAFGDFVAFEVGWMTCIARVSTIAGLSVFFARSVGYLWEGARDGIGKWVTVLVTLTALTFVNIRGVKSGARAAVVLTWGKIVPLALFVVVGLFAMKWGRVFPIPTPARENFGPAALLVLFAYAGFENTAAPAGEFKNPRRDIPFALIVTILLVTGIYTLVELVAIGTIPVLGVSDTPLAHAMRQIIGPAGGFILTLGAALSVLGTINNTILSGPRYLYALAERGVLPSFFARVHPKFHTPHVAILTQSGLAIGLMLTGTAEQLAELSVVARLATYVGTAAAVPILRRKMAGKEQALRLPGGAAIPAAALAICVLFLSAATMKNLIAGGVALLVGGAIFLLRRGSLPPPEELG